MSLDLRGLPPSRAELQSFSGDTAEESFARLVDTMLDSVHYGERMAQDWLAG